jgi:broad specificity phosphatase PhoE
MQHGSRPQHVLLCRHGQTDANAAGIVQGHLPTELNALGHTQARRLADRLATYEPGVERVVSSPLARAHQTAAAVGARLGVRVETDEGWSERHFGSGQGKPFDLLRIMTEGKLAHVDPEDAEPRDDFDARVRAALASLDAKRVTAVLTHGGVIGSVLRQIMTGAIPTSNPPASRHAVPNCSILHLRREVGATAWTLVCAPDAAHLEGLTTSADAG